MSSDIKKSRCESSSPSNRTEKNVPSLRFAEFGGDWKACKLGSFLVVHTERVTAKENDYPIYSSTRTGLKPQSDYYDNREIKNDGEYGVVPQNYFVYRHMSDDLTFKFNINKVGTKISVSKEYPVFTTQELNSDFLLLKLNFGNDFKKFASIQKLGGTRTRLYFKNLCTWNTLLPTLPEQQKIASFLSSVDSKISLLQEKHSQLQQYKKGVMQQLFNQKLRFTQADGSAYPDWEEKKLGDFGSFKSGSGFSNSEQGGTMGIPFYKVSDMNLPENQNKMNIANNYVTDAQIKNNKYKVINSHAYIFAKVGAAIFLERKRKAKNFLIDNNMMAFIPKNEVDFNFLGYLLNRVRLSKFAQIGALPSYNSSDLSIIKVPFPCIEEQQKIAECLMAIDAKIDAVADQLASVQAFKKGLLQKMFV